MTFIEHVPRARCWAQHFPFLHLSLMTVITEVLSFLLHQGGNREGGKFWNPGL